MNTMEMVMRSIVLVESFSFFKVCLRWFKWQMLFVVDFILIEPVHSSKTSINWEFSNNWEIKELQGSPVDISLYPSVHQSIKETMHCNACDQVVASNQDFQICSSSATWSPRNHIFYFCVPQITLFKFHLSFSNPTHPTPCWHHTLTVPLHVTISFMIHPSFRSINCAYLKRSSQGAKLLISGFTWFWIMIVCLLLGGKNFMGP